MECNFEGEDFPYGISEEQRYKFFEKMKPCVVAVEAMWHEKKERNISTGGGTVLNGDGLVLTAFHVIKDGIQSKSLTISFEGEDCEHPAEIVAMDAGKDLALIRPKSNQKRRSYAKVGYGETLLIGKQILSISHTNTLMYTFARGDISNAKRQVRELGSAKLYPDMNPNVHIFQVNHLHFTCGASGGPSFTTNGLLVGVITSQAKHNNFVIHLDVVEKFLHQHIAPNSSPGSSPYFATSAAPSSLKQKGKSSTSR